MEAQMQIPLFYGDEHELWSIKMRTFLMALDLWDVVESGVSTENPNQDMAELGKRKKDLRIKDMTALHMLQRSVTHSLLFRIARATSSKQAWELLKADFGETEEIQGMKMRHLEMKFEETTMKNEEKVWYYIGKLMDLVNRLKFYGRNIPDQEIILKILNSLPSRFDEAVRLIRHENFSIIQVVHILREVECLTTGVRSFAQP